MLEIRAKLLGGEPAAASVVVSAPYVEEPAEATVPMLRLLTDVGPLAGVLEAAAGAAR